MEPVQSSFPFFKLPLEIREEIYSHLLVAPKDKTITLTDREYNNTPSTICIKRHPCFQNHVRSNILSVCCRTYSEAVHFLYTKNMFDLQDKAVHFLDVIGERNRKLLRCIMVSWGPSSSPTSPSFRKTISTIARLRDSLTFVRISLEVHATHSLVRCLQRHVKAYGFRFKLHGQWVNNFHGRRAPLVQFVFGTDKYRWDTHSLYHDRHCGDLCWRYENSRSLPKPEADPEEELGEDSEEELEDKPKELEKPKPKYLFLQLPHHVRDAIYNHLLPHDENFLIEESESILSLKQPIFHRPTQNQRKKINCKSITERLKNTRSLLFVCKTISSEVSSFIYSRNTFSVRNTSIHALDLIGDKNLKRIKRLEILYSPQGPLVDDDTSDNYSNLEILRRRRNRDISYIKASPRYFRTVLNKLGTLGSLEKLTVKLMMPFQWKGKGVMETRLAEIVQIVQEFIRKYGTVEVEIRAMSCPENFNTLIGKQLDIKFEEGVDMTDTLARMSLD